MREIGVENPSELMAFFETNRQCTDKLKEVASELKQVKQILGLHARLRTLFKVDADLEHDVERCVYDRGECDWIVDAVARMCPSSDRMPSPQIAEGSTAHTLLRSIGAGLLPIRAPRALSYFNHPVAQESMFSQLKEWVPSTPTLPISLPKPPASMVSEAERQSEEYIRQLQVEGVIRPSDVPVAKSVVEKLNAHLTSFASKVFLRIPSQLRMHLLSGMDTEGAVQLLHYAQREELPSMCSGLDSASKARLRSFALQMEDNSLPDTLRAMRSLMPDLSSSETEVVQRIVQQTGRPALRSVAMAMHATCDFRN